MLGLFLATVLITSCKKDDKPTNLKNEFIKRTQTPMIVGTTIEFAYGAGSTNGKLANMQVIASIPGAAGTGFETVTHRTVNAVDITTVVATNAVTNGGTSTVAITDTAATTLRYIYVIPEAARGQQVSFAFSVSNKAGDQASTTTPAYTISNMDMARNITVTGTAAGSRYFSIADMRAYTQTEVDAGNLSGKIDFVYAYAATVAPSGTAYAYGHALVAPNVSATYLPAGYTVPAAWTKNNTLMERKSGATLYDGQLKGDANNSIYVADLDLQQQTFTGSPNYAIGLVADASVFMKTTDGKYTAFVYINSVNNTTPSAVISLKRYKNF